MARMPSARWLGEHSPGVVMSRYDIVCVHTIVGYAPAHAAHFSVHHDGTIDQSRDTRFRSGANLEGNHRVIAIENEDHGSAYGAWNTNNGHAVPAFTPAQIEANAHILAWAHKTHGIPLQLCPNSRVTSRGLAYHRQGIDGNFSTYSYPGRVSGGEHWSTSTGKVCPGDRRISARDQILTRAKQIITGIEVDEVSAQEVWTYKVIGGPQSGDAAITVLAEASTFARNSELGVIALNAKVDQLLAASGIDVDEAQLAAELAPQLAPLLIPHLSSVVTDLDAETLVEIATAVADEQARRLQA
jgi:hypothetical protein